jgi:two-component system chemotaxis response regulator CheV
MDDYDIRKLHLELGSSVFELIEFALSRKVGGQLLRGLYGVNVAKVREVVRMPKINALASRQKGIAGLFELRGIPIPAVNLAVALGDETAEVRSNQQIIVTEFSKKRAGFIVDSTHRIRRISWEKVLPPSSDASSCISGMTLVENNDFLFILDLEKILLTLEFGESYFLNQTDPVTGKNSHADYALEAEIAVAPVASEAFGKSYRILLVDDSSFIRNGCKQVLKKSGFEVVEAADGVEAFQVLQTEGQRIDLVVCDIEMPRMDGLNFTKKLREHPDYKAKPVILHTSLSGKANQIAGLASGANGYIIKNDFVSLFNLISELLGIKVAQKMTA